jgi:hypothetical protein
MISQLFTQMLHSCYPISLSQDLFKPQLNSLHAESIQLNPHLKLHSPVGRQLPVDVFQVILLPHGISNTKKPKITKMLHCACSAMLPIHALD